MNVKAIADKKSSTHPKKKRTCKRCGCTDARACRGGCYWVARDLCSRCEEPKVTLLKNVALAMLEQLKKKKATNPGRTKKRS